MLDSLGINTFSMYVQYLCMYEVFVDMTGHFLFGLSHCHVILFVLVLVSMQDLLLLFHPLASSLPQSSQQVLHTHTHTHI